MNMVFIAGNLGADPETRFAPSGQKITTLRLAAKTRRQGKEETIWWRVTIFGDRFDKMLTYLKKGSSAMVSGEMTTALWTDKEGRQQIQHEVIADSLKFSPFGRTDRPAEQGATSGAPSNSPSAYTPSYSAPQIQTHAFTPSPSHDFSFGDMSPQSSNSDEPPF
ncbi:MAG: single-stranded DNA-binding protein [Parachlamydiaceae bacterium]|nr:single-stranded DNA-binding protein [Parachlamydiaceae bacterium]